MVLKLKDKMEKVNVVWFCGKFFFGINLLGIKFVKL